jgi:hypothetical protein
MGESRSSNSVFVEKSTRKSPLEQPSRRWEDNKIGSQIAWVCACVMYPSPEKDHSQFLLVVEKEENFLTCEAGSVSLSQSSVHHWVNLNVHQYCSRLPVDRTLETQLLLLRGLELMTSCSPLKSWSVSYYSGQRPILPTHIW